MSRIIIIFSVIIALSNTFSTPYIADPKSVWSIRKVIQWTNESSTDPRIAVNLMFIHFKTALVNGDPKEVSRFFENPRDINKIFKPWVDDLLTIVRNAPMYFKRLSFSVRSPCIPTRFHSFNTTTCDVLIRWPFRPWHRQIKHIEVVRKANATHDLYENAWTIVSINRLAEEKLAEKWWEEYQKKMKMMEEERADQEEGDENEIMIIK